MENNEAIPEYIEVELSESVFFDDSEPCDAFDDGVQEWE